MATEYEVKQLIDQLSPDQLGVARALSGLRIENKMLGEALATTRHDYDNLFKVMLVILDAHPDKEMRIHTSQFMRLNEEWRIDTFEDKATQEVVLRLRTLKDGEGATGEFDDDEMVT